MTKSYPIFAKNSNAWYNRDISMLEDKQKTILVAEDDSAMRSIVVRKLKGHGFAVAEAADGKEALDKFNSEKPALAILDVMMPELDGFSVLEQVRKSTDPDLAKTPVIILTNLYSKEDIARARELGISGYFVKAYLTTEEIVKHVEEILKIKG